VERLLVGVVFGVMERVAERRERRNLVAVLFVSLDRAERQAQGERRVGILVLAAQGENSLADFRVRLLLRLLDLLFVVLAQRPRRRVHQQRELYHRVLGAVDGRLAAVEQRLARGYVAQLGPLDQLGRAGVRRFAVEDHLHQRVVGAL